MEKFLLVMISATAIWAAYQLVHVHRLSLELQRVGISKLNKTTLSRVDTLSER